jgi:hypothetical protein
MRLKLTINGKKCDDTAISSFEITSKRRTRAGLDYQPGDVWIEVGGSHGGGSWLRDVTVTLDGLVTPQRNVTLHSDGEQLMVCAPGVAIGCEKFRVEGTHVGSGNHCVDEVTA